jgi:DNA-binding Xre family transcriptional regulator
MPVINKIKPFLQSKGITPYRFQRDVAIAQRTAYDLYNNSAQLPSSNVLSKICDAYRIQPGEIIEWIDPSQNLTPAITQAAVPEMAPEQEAEWRARMLAQIDGDEEIPPTPAPPPIDAPGVD